MPRLLVVSFALLLTLVIFGCGSSQAPGTPTGLSITSTAPITLSWTAASGASSYVVYRGTAAGITNKIWLAGVSTTSYTDLTAAAGTTYFYQITALNDSGQSSPTGDVPATLTSFNLTGSVTSPDNILAWVGIPNATSYAVYRGTATGVYNPTPIATPTSTTYTYTDAGAVTDPVVTYYYMVRAYYLDSTGASASIDSVELILPLPVD